MTSDEIKTERDLEQYLGDLLQDDDGAIRAVSTFAEAGVLTNNAGLVARTPDGRQFQITIVRSR